MKNIILIGMPGCGKSTCGVLLAKTLCMRFCDTDLVIQRREGMPLQEIIEKKGNDYFTSAEEGAICTEKFEDSVVATGGSVVYSDKAMKHLSQGGTVIYLKISFETMMHRINNIKTRGILLKNGESIESMYKERQPLYEKYADITIDCDSFDAEDAVHAITQCVRNL